MTRKRAIPIHSDATRLNSSSVTPGPDAEGRVRLRDPGLGVGDADEPMFTLSATAPHAVFIDDGEGGDPISPLTHASFFSGVGGLQGSIWGSSEPDGGPSASLRSTPTPAPSSRSDGPASPTSVTSPVLLTMREGEPGGVKGPLLAVDESLTLAQGNGQVLFAIENIGRKMSGGPEVGKGWDDSGQMYTLDGAGRHGVARLSGPAASPARTSPSPASGQASAFNTTGGSRSLDYGDTSPSLRVGSGLGIPSAPSVLIGTPPPPAPASPSPSSTLWSDTDLPPSSSKTSRASSPVIAGETWRRSSVAFATSGMAWRTGLSTLATSECRSAADGSSSSVCEAIPTTLTDILQPSAPPRYSLSARAASGILRRAAKRGRALPEALEAALLMLASQTTAPSSSQVRRLTPVECERLMGWPDGWTIARSWPSGSRRTSAERSATPEVSPASSRPEAGSPVRAIPPSTSSARGRRRPRTMSHGEPER